MFDIKKRSLVLCGHKTSISLEEPFWAGLRSLAKSSGLGIGKYVEDRILPSSAGRNLSSSIRLHVYFAVAAKVPAAANASAA